MGDTGDVRVTARLRSTASSGAIGLVVRYRDADNHYRFSMDPDHGRRLVKIVGGVAVLLWSDSLYSVGREYAVAIDAIGDQLTVYVDGRGVAAVSDGDLEAGMAGVYAWANDSAEFREFRAGPPSWTSFYRFDGEEALPAGTVIRLRSGHGQADAQAGNESSRSIPGPGEVADVRFDGGEAHLRIVDPRGDALHEHGFLSDARFSVLSDLRVLRSADGTRCLVWVRAPNTIGAELKTGAHRLRWTYHRNNRAIDPGSLLLSQAGVANPEVVLLDVPWGS